MNPKGPSPNAASDGAASKGTASSTNRPKTSKPTEGGNYLNGALDDVRIYNRALGSAEIKAIYEAGTNGMARPTAKAPVRSIGSPPRPAPRK